MCKTGFSRCFLPCYVSLPLDFSPTFSLPGRYTVRTIILKSTPLPTPSRAEQLRSYDTKALTNPPIYPTLFANSTSTLPHHQKSPNPSSIISVETTVVVLIKKERKVGSDRGYVTRKGTVTISPVHRASLTTASPPPYPRLT